MKRLTKEQEAAIEAEAAAWEIVGNNPPEQVGRFLVFVMKEGRPVLLVAYGFGIYSRETALQMAGRDAREFSGAVVEVKNGRVDVFCAPRVSNTGVVNT